MSYLHCHTKGCNWSQDDFWSKTYNPFTKIWRDIKWLIKPHFIQFEKRLVDELSEYTGVPIWKSKVFIKNYDSSVILCPSSIMVKVFSWNWFILEFAKEVQIFKRQKWWTYKSFREDKKAVCPKCGKRCFDID